MAHPLDRPTRILLADYVPSLNKGELAILIGMLKTFELLGEVEVIAFSFYPQLNKERYPQNVKIIDVGSDLHIGSSLPEKSSLIITVSWLFTMLQHIIFSMLYAVIGDRAVAILKKMIWKEYCISDVIIICHDHVSCIFGSRPLRFFPLYITMLAKTLGKPVVVYANGFSSLERARAINKIGLWKILVRHVLNHVDLFTVRDEESYNSLNRILGDKVRIYLTADPAILLSPVNHERVRRMVLEENIDRNGGLLIGMTLTRGILLSAYPELKNPEERYEKAIAQMARLADHLTNNLNATVVFIPHCIQPYKQRDDREVAREIYNKTANKRKVVVITKEYSPEELKGLIGIFDLFIGARVHSVIGALTMGVPSITLTRALDRRAYGMVGKTMKQEEWIYKIEGLNSDKLLSKIMALLSRRDEISRSLALQTKVAKEKALLNGKLLKALLDSRTSK